MNSGKKVLVTGASGQLGRRLVPRLMAAGFSVRAHYRNEERGLKYCPAGVERVYGDLLSPDWLEKAVRDCDMVIHGAAWVSLRQVESELMYRVNVEGTKKMAAACVRAGVKRLLHISSVVTIGAAPKGEICDETTINNLADAGIPYFTTKYQAEQAAFDGMNSGLEVVVVNPSIMITPPGRAVTRQDMEKIPRFIPIYFDLGLNLVSTLDVVEGIVSALEKGRSGERYILAGENLDMPRAFRQARKFVSIRGPVLKIPRLLIISAGLARDAFYQIKRRIRPGIRAPRLGYRLARQAGKYFHYSSAKAEKELGYKFRTAELIIEDYLQYTGSTAENEIKPRT